MVGPPREPPDIRCDDRTGDVQPDSRRDRLRQRHGLCRLRLEQRAEPSVGRDAGPEADNRDKDERRDGEVAQDGESTVTDDRSRHEQAPHRAATPTAMINSSGKSSAVMTPNSHASNANHPIPVVMVIRRIPRTTRRFDQTDSAC